MLLVRQKIAPRFLAAACKHGFRDRLIGESLEAKDPPSELNVRNGLDVEYQPVHRPRADTMSERISRTAAGSPSNSARAMMAWPILSSTISPIAATGCTL